MKKLFSLLVLLCCWLAAGAQSNESFINGDICYSFIEYEGETALIVKAKPEDSSIEPYSGDIVIPSKIIMEHDGNIVEHQVVAIDEGAFSGCTGLTSITIPATIKTIYADAFYDCYNLEKVTFGSIESLCAMAFRTVCSNPLYLAHHLYISDSDSEITDLVVPEGVTSIGDYAFMSCTSLTSVSLPATITEIGNKAFNGDTNLKKAYFADIKSMCSTAFNTLDANPLYLAHHLYIGESEVTDVTIPDDLSYIKPMAFAGGTEIVKVVIPSSVVSIGKSAFKDCNNINVVDFASLSQVTSMNYSDREANPLNYADYLSVNGVLTEEIKFDSNIPQYIFPNSKWLKRVVIGEGVTSIGEGAFNGCTSLTSVTFPSTLQSIGMLAFNRCSSLSSITLPSGLKSIGVQAFRDCRQIRSVVIPDGTALEHEVFMYCSNLETATLPSAIVTIPERLFLGCSNLKNIVLPSTVQTINAQAFSGCGALENVLLSDNMVTIQKGAFENCTGFKSLVLNEKGNINFIGEGAFKGCSGVTSLTLPATTQNILARAFADCSSLAQVYCLVTTVPDADVTAFGSNEGNMQLHVPEGSEASYQAAAPWMNFTISVMGTHTLTFIVNDNNAEPFFQLEQEGGTTIDLSAIQEPADGIFSGWDKVIPETMPSEDMTFYGYVSHKETINGLAYHLLPAEKLNGRNLERRAMVIASLTGENYSMEEYKIPASVTYDGVSYPVIGVDAAAFKGCSNIVTIELPSSMTTLGEEAFSGCSKLMTINIPEGVTTISNHLFDGCAKLNVTIPDGITEIGAFAFSNCKVLEVTALPASLKKLGQQAFRSCENIKSIELPATLEDVEQEVFFYCLHLKTVKFAEGFTLSIPDRLFQNCFDLEEISFASGMKNIGDGAFENCNSLTSVVIPEGFVTIGGNAFRGCTSLANVTLPASVVALGDQAFAQCLDINQLTVNRATPPAALSTTFAAELAGKNAYLFVPEDADQSSYAKAPWNYFTVGSRETKTLTYIVDDGNGTCDEDVEKTMTFQVMVGDRIEPIAEPTLGTHEFSGWQGVPSVMPGEDVVVRGSFKYDVRFYEDENNEAKRLLKDNTFSFFYGEKIVLPENLLVRANNTFKLSGVPEDSLMTADDLDIIVTYELSEWETTIDDINYKVWVKEDHAEVMPTLEFTGNSLSLRDYVTYNGKNYPVTAIHEGAFSGLRSITTIAKWPAQLQAIGSQAFRGCRFSEITLPATVTNIDSEAFLYCGALKKVEFAGNGVKTLSPRVFQNCSGLEEITLPGALETIGEAAFNGCYSMKSIDLPASLLSLESYVFTGCMALDTINVLATAMPAAQVNTFGEDADDYLYQNATLFVPAGVNLQTLPEPWSIFANKQNPEGALNETCETPTITYSNGRLSFACATEGVTFVSSIQAEDVASRTAQSIDLTKTYTISVYARKAGYKNSKTVTATLRLQDIGDVNGDGEITAQDASLLLQHVAKKIQLTESITINNPEQ